MAYFKLDYFDWQSKYKPIRAENDDTCDRLFETYGDELKTVLSTPLDRVWTLLDNDAGDSVIVNGYHIVNRQGYFITEEPFNIDDEIEIDD